MALIELLDLTKTYSLGEVDVPVLHGVTLNVYTGDFVALMGASGSGKSTLMNILGCLDRPTTGKYLLESVDISTLSRDEHAVIRNRKIGFVFQNFNLLRRTSALENVLMPASYAPEPENDSVLRKRAEELLARVGIADRMHHEPSQLSGGQQQRVAIARALMNNPSIILADEPTGNLDSRTTDEVLKLFDELNREGRTIIIVTHETDVAKRANRIVQMVDGRIAQESPGRLGL